MDSYQKNIVKITKSHLEGIFNFWFQNLLINIDECNSRSKRTDIIYDLYVTLFLLKVQVPCKKCTWYKIMIMIF
jgi:hypothetical protein